MTSKIYGLFLKGFSPHGRKCKDIRPPTVSGAEVVSISTAELQRGKVCSVNVTLTHPGVDDEVKVWVWLPAAKEWNGRFQGVGGGGWTAGQGEVDLVVPVSQGYAAGSTDAGGQDFFPKGADGPNLGLLNDFASRSLHEMTLVGKQLAKSLYGREPHHSYWNGCSTGGRQGHILAQKYPTDYDGILGAAPALYWPSFNLALWWPDFVMNYIGLLPSQCELAVFQKAVIDKCDELDGVKDGVISNLEACKFDPHSVVGTEVECYGKQITISDRVAEIVRLVHQGPRSPSGFQLWDGYDYGANYDFILRTLTDDDGETTLFEEPSLGTWIRVFLKKDPEFDLKSIKTLDEVTELFASAHSEYGGMIGTDDPDLSAFRNHGGKLLSWHGLGDNLIMANNSLRYRQQVEQVMGGNNRVNEFYRLFLAPGVGHCAVGYGPVPTSPLDTLVDWVEKNKVPKTLGANFTDSEGHEVKRNLCPWPLVSKYKGKGDIRSAGSYSCETSY
ncbi:Tannase/feruloyl esterase [Aspergillus pseudodeflectus]|uniref:Carboxylic ester hydrolase n=1 Tax=Aspergillus pseudodeflectus TaxID=176178 RepID=A0ABR4JHC2_9EURO